MTTARAFTAAQASGFRLARQHLARQHLAPRTPHAHAAPRTAHAAPPPAHAAPVHVCRDTAGIQAQVMSAAELSIWTRGGAVTPDDIRGALWRERAIVRTSAMRMTLHLIPANDHPMYVAAMKPSVSALIDRVFARLRARPADRDRVHRIVLDALADGPQTQQALIARVSEGATPGMRAWLKYSWTAVRPLVVDGLVVYGPPRGGEVTFVRTDQWLPRQRSMDTADGRAALMRRFLSAFGPASAHDFAKWSGMKVTDAKATVAALRDELVEVTIDGAHAWMLGSDVPELAASRLDVDAVRMLPAFDTLLLAHATKEHLVDRRNFSRVYRPQGWISPVVLQGERIVAVWFPQTVSGRMTIDVQPFARLTRRTRAAIEREADAVGRFVGMPAEVRYSEGS